MHVWESMNVPQWAEQRTGANGKGEEVGKVGVEWIVFGGKKSRTDGQREEKRE